MPPEQAAEGIVTFRSDIYTLGLTFACLFFEDLNHSDYRMPFLVEWHQGWRPSSLPSALGDQHPLDLCVQLESLIEGMTKRQPSDRIQTVQLVDESLSQIENQARAITPRR